jgi:hypothetical protein
VQFREPSEPAAYQGFGPADKRVMPSAWWWGWFIVYGQDTPPAPDSRELALALSLRDDSGRRVRRLVARWCPGGPTYRSVRG